MSKTKQRRPPSRRYGRPQAKNNWVRDLPLLPVAVAGILLLAAIGAIVYASANKAPAGSGTPVDGISCEQNEQLAVHYHAHLAIFVAGNPALLPAQIGINSSQQCLYWLHTHSTDGVIHIEAPKGSAVRKFTLGDFFDVWGQPLNRGQFGATKLAKGESMTIYVDGKAYSGDPRQVVLTAHGMVVVEIGTPVVPPPAFTFPAGE